MEKKQKIKFNIVDVLVLVIILAVAGFFVWKSAGSKADKSKEEKPTVTIRYVVEVDGMDAAMYAEAAKRVPFTMVAGGKELDGTVVSCESEPCTVVYKESQSPVNNSMSQWLVPDEGDSFVNAFFVCEAEVDPTTRLNQVGSQEVRIGRSHYVKGLEVELNGTIISLEQLDEYVFEAQPEA